MSTPTNVAGRRPTRGRKRYAHEALETIWLKHAPTELPHIVVKSATETGQAPEVLANLIVVALRSLHAQAEPAASLEQWRGRPDPEAARRYLYAADALIANLREFTDELKSACPDEVPSSHVRKNWAEILDRVHAGDEIVYVTQHQRRIAAIVPPYVAESYEADQAWFWTDKWQEKEREADEDIAAGRVRRFDSDGAFLDSLDVEDESD